MFPLVDYHQVCHYRPKNFPSFFSLIFYAGGPVSIWKNLCLFTYFLIDNSHFDIYELFIQQFVLFMHTKSVQLSKYDFNEFVKIMFGYFSVERQILDNPLAAINTVRMIGVLPLEAGNFCATDDYARKLSDIILKKVSQQLKPIFEKMDAIKWVLFKDGLTILMSIEILNDKKMDTEADSIALLYQIPADENKQQQIVDAFFQELMTLKIPIQRIDWIELLQLVDKQKVGLDCLCLATTFDHILCCLEHVVPRYEINDKNRDKISTALETQLKNNSNITCKLSNEIIKSKFIYIILCFSKST